MKPSNPGAKPARLQIAAATYWWAELRFKGDKKRSGKAAVAFWVFRADGSVYGVAFDGRRPFLLESDSEMDVTFVFDPDYRTKRKDRKWLS